MLFLGLMLSPSIFSFITATIVPAGGSFAQNLALTSMMITSPEGATKVLEERYSYEIDKLPSPSPSLPLATNSPQPSKVPTPTPSVNPTPTVNPSATPNPIAETPLTAPDIPKEYTGTIVNESFSGENSSVAELIDGVYINNTTDLTTEDIENILSQPLIPATVPDNSQPQVLVYQTHATESFEVYDSDYYDTRGSWRSTDNNMNMVAVAQIMVEELQQNGINVIQDRAQHDYPSYTGSYSNSANAIEDYLKEYPSISFIIDMHRDALEREGNIIVKPVTIIDDKKYSQIMIMVCRDEENPNWENNLRLAVELYKYLEMYIPNINRPIYLRDGKYNQHLADSALLIEIGSHANTILESKSSADILGKALSKVLAPDK